jgi:hypothetical protein
MIGLSAFVVEDVSLLHDLSKLAFILAACSPDFIHSGCKPSQIPAFSSAIYGPARLFVTTAEFFISVMTLQLA